VLVQVCGLPGVGKSTISAAIAAVRPVVLLRLDAIEASMWNFGVPRGHTGIAAYGVTNAVALAQLDRGLTVVADAVSPVAAARDGWRSTASAAGAELRVIEVVCPDRIEHRRRVESRPNDIPGFTLPTWEDALAMQAEYEPRTDDRLVLDGTADPATNLRVVLEYLGL
jgi:predicted kinase